MTSPLRETPKGFFLHVKATPKAARDEIAGLRAGELLVKVTAAPEKGKANQAIVALLAQAMGVPKSAFELAAGETARSKRFRIASHREVVHAWLHKLAVD